MARRIGLSFSLLLAALAVALIGSTPASAAIGPPWCGTPSPDATAALPDGTGRPTRSAASRTSRGTRSAARSTQIEARSTATDDGRGHRPVGARPRHVPRRRSTRSRRSSRRGLQALAASSAKLALEDPGRAQDPVSSAATTIKVPDLHPGRDPRERVRGRRASLQIIKRLATTPYGADPEVDDDPRPRRPASST